MNRRHRLSRVASTSQRASHPDPFFQGPSSARKLATKSEPSRAKAGYRGTRQSEKRRDYDSEIERHSTVDRNEISRELNRRLDLQPIPNIESPINKRIPDLMGSPNNREANLIRPIPTRWASKKIDWDHIALASHVVRDNSESDRQSPRFSRGLREKRIKRFDSRFHVPRSLRESDRGWSKLEE